MGWLSSLISAMSFLHKSILRFANVDRLKIVDPGFFYFTAMRVSKFLDLFHKSLYQVLSKNDITYSYFLLNSFREKAALTCQLSSRQHPE